ncbi:MAG: amidohydrolase family protein [Betaproteobacteria bacterium]
MAAALAVARQSAVSTRNVALALSEGTSMAAAMSPDGRSVAVDLIGALWILPAGGGEARRITPDRLEARQPAWSPDSRTIAFQGYGEDAAWHVYTIAPDGNSLRQLTDGPFDDREPLFSHDGRRIAFSSDRAGGITAVWTLDVATGTIARASTRDGWMPIWSPDDREIAFVSSDTIGSDPSNGRASTPGVWAVDGSGQERLLVDARRGGMPAAIAWSPDGSQLAATGGDEIGTHLTVGGHTISSAGEDVFPFRPQWLGEGELLYTAAGHIVRRSLPGHPPVRIPFTAHLTLARDVYTIAGRTLEPTAPQPVAGIVSPVVSPDGRFIAFAARGDLWLLPAEGGSPIPVSDDPFVESDPAWSPDGRALAFTSDRGGSMNVWVRDLRTGRDRQVTALQDGAASGAAWSPDGTRIAFLVNRTDLGIVDARGGPVARSRPGFAAGELGRPTWSADSRSVAVGALSPFSPRYREGLNQVLIERFDPVGWSSLVLYPGHSAGNRQTQGPVWAPDGRHMAFASEGRLWVVPTEEGGAPTKSPVPITAAVDPWPDSPSWEGDSRHLVYLTATGLRRVGADGGPSRSIACTLAWQTAPTPDRIVVHAGHLFDGVTDALEGARDIVIEHGVIREVALHRDDLHAGTLVDASDEVVIPGLIDMHTHLDPDYGSALGRIWLAYGVTSVRNPSVNPYVGLEMREAFASGRRPGPRVFLSGQAFDGSRVFYPGYMPIVSRAELDAALRDWSRFPLDFFKTYVRLPDVFQKAVVRYAHATAHAPVTSHELYPGVAFGVDGVEHLRGTSRRGYSPKVSTMDRSYRDVVDTIVRSGMTLTPTVGIQGAFALEVSRNPQLADDERLTLFPPDVAARVRAMRNPTASEQARLNAAMRAYGKTIKAIADGGGTLLAGTDSPIIPFGLSLHLELQAYVDAGLTPFQALQTATLNAARALGQADRLGTIEPGRLADLTFLGGDPLADIRQTLDVRRVMKGGRVYETRN